MSVIPQDRTDLVDTQARANLRNQHKALDVLSRIADRQTDLLKLYGDEDG
jgi:hypothetical protein